MNFYKDNKSVLALLSGSTENLAEIIANSVDDSAEKHVPVYEITDNKLFVKIGAVEHPMEEKHFIEWIAVQTNKGFYTKFLKPHEKPTAFFALYDEKVVAVYAYCNIHGLWKA